MHLSDTLVFSPLHPLLPRPVRVRLVALLVGLVGCFLDGRRLPSLRRPPNRSSSAVIPLAQRS